MRASVPVVVSVTSTPASTGSPTSVTRARPTRAVSRSLVTSVSLLLDTPSAALVTWSESSNAAKAATTSVLSPRRNRAICAATRAVRRTNRGA